MARTALATYRTGTFINKDCSPEVDGAGYRTGTVFEVFVDRFRAGVRRFPVDFKIGRMLPGVKHGSYDPSPSQIITDQALAGR